MCSKAGLAEKVIYGYRHLLKVKMANVISNCCKADPQFFTSASQCIQFTGFNLGLEGGKKQI